MLAQDQVAGAQVTGVIITPSMAQSRCSGLRCCLVYVSVDLGKALETGVACMVRCFFASVLFSRGHRVVQSQVS